MFLWVAPFPGLLEPSVPLDIAQAASCTSLGWWGALSLRVDDGAARLGCSDAILFYKACFRRLPDRELEAEVGVHGCFHLCIYLHLLYCIFRIITKTQWYFTVFFLLFLTLTLFYLWLININCFFRWAINFYFLKISHIVLKKKIKCHCQAHPPSDFSFPKTLNILLFIWILTFSISKMSCLCFLLHFKRHLVSLNQSILRKSTLNIHWKNWCWNSNTLATWLKKTDWKRFWGWERLSIGEGPENRGWDG